MRPRRLLPLLALVATLLVALAPASAFGAIEILNRGVSPDPPVVGQKSTLTVDVTVGQAPFIAEFQCCNIFTNNVTPEQSLILDENSPLTQSKGPTRLTFEFDPGSVTNVQRIITVRIADSNGDLKTLDIPFQAPIVPPPPQPEPARIIQDNGQPGAFPTGVCERAVEVGRVVKAVTQGGGCWEQSRQGGDSGSYSGVPVQPRETIYTTTDRFALNGIPFPAPPTGSRYVLVDRTGKGPLLGIDKRITVKLKDLTIIDRPFQLELPFGSPVSATRFEGVAAAFSIPTGRLGGQAVGGSVTAVFVNDNGRFSTRFPVQVTLPAVITPSPGTIGAVTGATEITTDETRGVSFDGGKIEVKNVAIGKLGVEQLCFSYLSAGVSSSFAACEPPELTGAKTLPGCEPPTQGVERFDGNIVVILPTSRETKLGAYAGVFGGRFGYAGAFIDDAGIPIVQGVTLERLGFALCVNPLTIRGDAGAAIGQGALRGDVAVIYQELAPGFSVEAQGLLRAGVPGQPQLGTIPLGSGRVKVFSTGRVELGVQANTIVAGGFISIEGGVSGIIVPTPTFRYQVEGFVDACIANKFICAGGEGTVSNVGISGCGKLGAIKYSGFFRFRDRFTEHGFGCGFSKRARIFTFREHQGTITSVTFPVDANEPQYVAHVQGQGAPPKVRVTSPSGKVFESGPNPGTTDGATFIIAEDPNRNETSIFLGPGAAAGDWKVEPLAGSAPLTGTVEFQDAEREPTVIAGTVANATRGRKAATVRYALAEGETIGLDVVGEGYQQTLSSRLNGAACPKGATAPGRTAGKSRCQAIIFTPTFGYAGPRTLQATVYDAQGAIVKIIDVAKFTAPKPAIPTLPPDIRLVRKGTSVIAVWGNSTGNVRRYGGYAVLSDGRKLGFTGPARCLAWRIPNVAKTTRVRFRIQAGRQDLAFGKAGSLTLKAKAAYAGPKALRGKRTPKACESRITV